MASDKDKIIQLYEENAELQRQRYHDLELRLKHLNTKYKELKRGSGISEKDEEEDLPEKKKKKPAIDRKAPACKKCGRLLKGVDHTECRSTPVSVS
jgi:hypothetical protein